MALLENTLFGKVDKVATAIERIRTFDPSKIESLKDLAPYYVAYSGGKDSDVLRILFELSGVEYDLVHNHTTVDAPETVRYVRSIPGIQISYPNTTMWELIVKKKVPPTRIMRYCCEFLKERGGEGRFVATGVRWAESFNRLRKRSSLEVVTRHTESKLILNADNDEHRRQFEVCAKKGKRILNPIVDWKDEDVWEFLHHYGCKSNPLYECGFSRIGCVGCPMPSYALRIMEFNRYPKYKDNYIRAFERMITARIESGPPLPTEWRTGQDVYKWWVSAPRNKQQEHSEQLDLFDEAK